MAADPIRIKRIAFGISIATAAVAGALLIIIQPVEPSVGREYIGRVFAICVLGGLGSLPGTLIAAHAARRGRKHHRDILRPVLGAGGVVRLPAADARVPALRIAGALTVRMPHIHPGGVRWSAPWCSCCCSLPGIEYLFFAGYTIVQYIVLATAWNILGGYSGYVNFGSAAFFAIGAYSSVALITFGTQLEDLVPESLASPLQSDFPAADPGSDRGRRRRLRASSASAWAI